MPEIKTDRHAGRNGIGQQSLTAKHPPRIVLLNNNRNGSCRQPFEHPFPVFRTPDHNRERIDSNCHPNSRAFADYPESLFDKRFLNHKHRDFFRLASSFSGNRHLASAVGSKVDFFNRFRESSFGPISVGIRGWVRGKAGNIVFYSTPAHNHHYPEECAVQDAVHVFIPPVSPVPE